MSETFLDGKVTLHCGDCLDVLDALPENSLDACVTDPPYHFASIVKRFGAENAAPAQHGSDGAFARASRGFMGKLWDGGDIAFRPETWVKVLRVLKPGAHVLAFAAPKNVGHLQTAIERAGFETRDCLLDLIDLDPVAEAFVSSLNDAQRAAFFRLLDEGSAGGLLAWIFGSGFPKSHDVAKAIDKKLGCKGDYGAPKSAAHAGWIDRGAMRGDGGHEGYQRPWMQDTAAVDRNARQYLPGSSEAQQYVGFGTAMKPAFEPIVLARKPLEGTVADNVLKWGTGALNIDGCRIALADDDNGRWGDGRRPGGFGDIGADKGSAQPNGHKHEAGRFPANVLHDGSPGVLAAFPSDAPAQQARTVRSPAHASVANGANKDRVFEKPADGGGSAARFFYSAKADADDRLGSKHPTVKPLDLMQYLVRLVTAPGQTVLDLFAGTGTTAEAAFREGRRAVLIEREAEYQDDIRRRMRLTLGGPEERAREARKARGDVDAPESLPLFGGVDAVTPPAAVDRSMACSPMKRDRDDDARGEL